MKKLVRRGFAVPYLINCMTINVMKLNCLNKKLEKNICLIVNCSVSDNFSVGIAVYIQVVI